MQLWSEIYPNSTVWGERNVPGPTSLFSSLVLSLAKPNKKLVNKGTREKQAVGDNTIPHKKCGERIWNINRLTSSLSAALVARSASANLENHDLPC